MGQAITEQFENSKSKWLVLTLVLGAVVLGAAAYEMGNLLGAVAGFQLIVNAHSYILVLISGLFSMAVLIVGTSVAGTFSFEELASAL